MEIRRRARSLLVPYSIHARPRHYLEKAAVFTLPVRNRVRARATYNITQQILYFDWRINKCANYNYRLFSAFIGCIFYARKAEHRTYHPMAILLVVQKNLDQKITCIPKIAHKIMSYALALFRFITSTTTFKKYLSVYVYEYTTTSTCILH